jgi:2-polyprenyl-6-methoxyphenol hydroxylase-like FAD-dependent oxidoreductase
MTRGEAIVVGAGIGGLTVGTALVQDGWSVRVYERRDSLQDIAFGAGLGIYTNGIRALGQIGLAEQVAQSGTSRERFDQRSWRGDLIASWPVGEMARKIGSPSIDLTRSALIRILGQAVGADALRVGVACTGFEQDGDGVTVGLSDGATERCQLLIGSDGINSTVRTQLLGPIKPTYQGYTAWRGLVNFHHEAVPLHMFQQFWGRGRRIAFYHVDEEGLLFWMAIANAPEGERDTEGAGKARVAGLFEGCAEPIPAMIDATAEAEIQRLDVYDLDPIGSWAQGRVTLMGDAAHAMTFNTGQGACQAILDGVALAKHLRAADDIPSGLRAFEGSRRKRAASQVRLSRLIGKLGRWDSPVACAARERIIWKAILGPLGVKGQRATMAQEV